jgi:hypothetical protein
MITRDAMSGPNGIDPGPWNFFDPWNFLAEA